MPRVFLPAMLRPLAQGQEQVELAGATVRQLIDNLEARFPGIKARLVEDGMLRPNVAVAIDGEVSPLGLIEQVAPASEVHFVLALSGG